MRCRRCSAGRRRTSAAFGIVSDGCAGRSLGAGGSCQVVVRFAAGAPGARRATLEVGPVQSTLQGFNYGGRTRLDITGQPGEGDRERRCRRLHAA
jgi:hypothetical protein